jgi:hypothetical protein
MEGTCSCRAIIGGGGHTPECARCRQEGVGKQRAGKRVKRERVTLVESTARYLLHCPLLLYWGWENAVREDFGAKPNSE